MDTFALNHTTKNYPRLPYEAIKNDILGRQYRLSLNFIGSTRAAALNRTYRQKDYVPNVLSFPLDAKTGEIFIAPAVAKKEAPRFSLTPKGYAGYLFIHGLLHLKGFDHGPQMETLEKKFMNKYKLS